MPSGDHMITATDLGADFKEAASEFYSKFNENDKHTMASIIRAAGKLTKQAVMEKRNIAIERVHLEAQFDNLSAKVAEDAKTVFFKTLGKRLTQIAEGMLLGL